MPIDDMPFKARAKKNRAEILGWILVCCITIGFGITLSVLLWAKWRNFDPYMHDFAEAARIYEKLLRGVPYDHRMHYYLYIYMGICPALLPFYTILRNIALIFSVHILSFTLAIPLLYLIARQMLPGVLLPLAVVTCYVLNPTVDLTAIGFLRLEACWMPLFLTLYLINRGFLSSRRVLRHSRIFCATGRSARDIPSRVVPRTAEKQIFGDICNQSLTSSDSEHGNGQCALSSGERDLIGSPTASHR